MVRVLRVRLASAIVVAAAAFLAGGASRCGGDKSVSQPTPQPTPRFSLLSVSKRQIVDDQGAPVRLRGVNLGGWLVKEGYILHFPGPAYDAPSEIDTAIRDLAGNDLGEQLLAEHRDQWISEPDLAEIAALGFNSVRLPLHHQLLWDFDAGLPREDGLAFLDRVVGWCESHHLWIVLDLHCAPGGQNAGNISDSDGTARLFGDARNEQATIALWRTLAARYAGRRAVAGYDLLNEPVWSDGPAIEPLYRRIVAAIREVDPNHLIILEGNTWDTDFSIFSAPFDSRLVYSFHKYWNDTTLDSISPYLSFSTRYNVPLWLGETGENNNTWYQQTLTLMRDNDIGWCFWPWKKVWADNCPLSVEPPAGTFELISNYLNGNGPRPTAEQTATAWRAMLTAAQPTRCKRNQSVIDLLVSY
jgi:endoglucanase